MEKIIKYLIDIVHNQIEQKQLILSMINKKATTDDGYLLAQDVLCILKISIRKLWTLRKNKELPFEKFGRTVYFRKSDVFKYQSDKNK